jgi:hypothetical protein
LLSFVLVRTIRRGHGQLAIEARGVHTPS